MAFAWHAIALPYTTTMVRITMARHGVGMHPHGPSLSIDRSLYAIEHGAMNLHGLPWHYHMSHHDIDMVCHSNSMATHPCHCHGLSWQGCAHTIAFTWDIVALLPWQCNDGWAAMAMPWYPMVTPCPPRVATPCIRHQNARAQCLPVPCI